MHQTTRNYLIPISVGVLLSLTAFSSIVWSVDPQTAGWIGFILFFLTLFLSLSGLFTLGGIYFRKRFSPGVFTEQLRVSFRQAFLLALLIISLVILQIFNLLFWWAGLTLILFIITVEIFLNA